MPLGRGTQRFVCLEIQESLAVPIAFDSSEGTRDVQEPGRERLPPPSEDLDDVVRDASGKARVFRQHFAFDWGSLDTGDIGQQICDAGKIEQ